MAKLQMLSSLGFSEAVYGLGAGIFFIGYLLFDVPSNLILHRVGARWWLGRIMISWGVISAGTAFIATPFWFYALRFLLAVAVFILLTQIAFVGDAQHRFEQREVQSRGR